ncbi:hypothetical protein LPTSP2_37590 [Leptospira ellinghausenii]|uniref:Uncharacterized protein n=1 Tax=Leptospira ellinghausenii TaxID=1917822 RepID=A0A2P2DIH9_9LEPT|nr:hypothetical protein [Leptospira ellinghausenii]GBF44456.1 hypothetical protein LPTSP2_37590 [Leptospira ellinghausenii]
MIKTNYCGFYTARPFWIDKLPQIEPFDESSYKSSINLVTNQHLDSEIKIKAWQDGLIALSITKLESIGTKIGRSLNFPKVKMMERENFWGEYFKALNILQLIIDSSLVSLENNSSIQLLEVNYLNVLRFQFDNKHIMNSSAPVHGYSSKFFNARDVFKLDLSKSLLVDEIFYERQIISAETINHAFIIFSLVYKNKELFQHLDDIYRSLDLLPKNCTDI